MAGIKIPSLTSEQAAAMEAAQKVLDMALMDGLFSGERDYVETGANAVVKFVYAQVLGALNDQEPANDRELAEDMSLPEEAEHVRKRSLNYGDRAFGRNGEEVRVYKAELR